ncbi:hypothetical protein DICPUDRAFT_76233 [Dictyostelium purpureum]|uniref:Glucosamine 6-phosphate N-acetyltransferase n=1 Tax=Dictyostelium purpureum TaxID=5786 RepID=F0ZD02_DICPU|nr:uncharacterized protein DICPUDRAFT_76233 [Dictyostelium purpureum]EGC38157.1 hypothetical protein DICPUDRAFT_76233 [Dictyostelium purpureum]|eukprot:XP_003285284.1 hypothetical protein DICPUDRAFT_76233 [Dictyostelium purpureum]
MSSSLLKEPREIDEIVYRFLEISDFEKGFSECLQQLTEAKFTKSQFIDRYSELKKQPDTYFIVVAEDLKKKKIIACGTLFVEKKFIRNCGTCGHIEDIVVDKTYRGKNLGLRIIEQLTHIGKKLGCYKLILDCSDSNVKFYEKCLFEKKGVQMSLYLPMSKL